MAGAGETGLEVGALMHNGPWEAPFSPVAGAFTGSSSSSLKRTPHSSPLLCQSFLSHNSQTAVSGWRCVIVCSHLHSSASKDLEFARVVVVACSHLVSNMLHVSYLMVWLLTSAGQTNWLVTEKKKHKRAMWVNTWTHFSKVTHFFHCCRFHIEGMVSFNHNIMLLAQSIRKRYFLIMTGEHNLWSDIKWNQQGMFSCGEQNSALQFWRGSEMSPTLTDTRSDSKRQGIIHHAS